MPDPVSGIIGGVSLVGNVLESKATKKASDKQAQSIKDAQGISKEAAAEARASALALFDPAFADISTSLNQARGDLLAGRVSSQDLLNNAFSKSNQTLQTSAQQSMSALLGLPSPEAASTAQDPSQFQPQPTGDTLRGSVIDSAFNPKLPKGLSATARDINARGIIGDQPQDLATDNAFARPAQAGVGSQPTRPTYNPATADAEGYDPVSGSYAGMGPFRGDDPRADFPAGYDPETGWMSEAEINQREMAPVTSSMQPLEGEFIPASMAGSDYNVQAPQGNYGLAGSESALRQSLGAQAGFLTEGAYGAMDSANRGFDQARSDVTGAFGTGLDLLRQGVDTGRRDITGQLDSGLSALRQGVGTGRGDIRSSSQSAINRFNPYVETGQSALDVEAARSGALGTEAQAQAFADYNTSPGQDWAREQMEKSTLRTQNALGGSQGGDVLKALQRERQGLSSQNYQRDLENLRSLASRGQQATGSQAGIETQAGRDMSALAMRGGEAELSARQSAGNQLAQMEYGAATTGAGMAERGGSALSNLASNRGLYNAGTQKDLGRDLSSAYGRAGENVSNLRMNAGQMIAQQLGLTGQQVSQLESQLGTSLANVDMQTITNMANQSAQQGGATSNLRTDLASLLSNLATGQGTNQAGMQMQLGNAQAGGVTNPWGNAASQITGMYASNPSMFSGAATPAGSAINDYTGNDYSRWVAGQ